MLGAVRWTSPTGELVMKGHALTLASVLLVSPAPVPPKAVA